MRYSQYKDTWPVFSYNLRYIVGFGLVNPKPTIYRNLYENTDPGFGMGEACILMIARRPFTCFR